MDEQQQTPPSTGDPHYLFPQPPSFFQSCFPEMGSSSSSTTGLIEERQILENFMPNFESNRINNGRRKKNLPQRFAFQTRSEEDVLDDGYRWRKYGQKSLKNSNFPRSYYRCTHDTCNVKKQVERLSGDSSIVMTTYDGSHHHPSHNLIQSLTPLLNQIHFLTSPPPDSSSLN